MARHQYIDLQDTPTVLRRSPEKDTLKTAIELFRASATSKTTSGALVLKKLDDALASGTVSFGDLPPGLEGESHPSAGTIIMNRSRANDPVNVSIWLVHEAYHLAIAGTPNLLEIDEEINSREVQGQYWLELESGLTYDGQTYKSNNPDGQCLRSYQKNRIVDWVFSLPEYTQDAKFLTQAQAWIAAHIQDWGGITNRILFTIEIYARLLVKKPEKLTDIGPGARALFAILDAQRGPDVKTIVKYVGDGDFRTGVNRISERMKPAAYGSLDAVWDDILAWQKRNFIDLGFKPR